MKAPRLSVAAAAFAILVIAIDLAAIRAIFSEPRWEARGLPLMLIDPIYGPGPKGWTVFAFFLLPVINVLLIGAYHLLRHRDGGTAGFVTTGFVATTAVFIACQMSPDRVIGLCMSISRKIALPCFQGLARLTGHGYLLYRAPTKWTYGYMALEWTYAIIFAVLMPMAIFCFLPLIFAVIGGGIGRHCRRSQAIDAGGRQSEMDGGLDSLTMSRSLIGAAGLL